VVACTRPGRQDQPQAAERLQGLVVKLARPPRTLGLGRGFDPTAATSGFGLLGMRERVELLNGELTVESAPGNGTQITVSLPPARSGQELPEASLFRLNA
jgi:hypothetical protein